MKIENVIKKLPSGYVDEANSLSDTQLKAQIIQCEANVRDIKAAQDADVKLQGAKELVKDLSGPYKEAVGAQRAKIDYILHLLEERGTLPGANHGDTDSE